MSHISVALHSANSASNSLTTGGVGGLGDPFIIAGERALGDINFGESAFSSGVLKMNPNSHFSTEYCNCYRYTCKKRQITGCDSDCDLFIAANGFHRISM